MEGKTEIKVQGHLDKNWRNWYDGMDVSYENGDTILSIHVKDEAFIHGILNLIRDLNLKLISVNPVE